MKFLGEYSFEVASIWKDKLEDEEIFPIAEEVGGFFGASWATMGTLRPRIRLFVDDNNYDRAFGLIKNLERNFEMKVEVYGKEADKAMLKVLIGFICFMGVMIFLIGIKEVWW